MERIRIALLVVAILAAFACIGFMGVDALTNKIYNSRDCEFANIDNVEMHARIDIPSTRNCECNYDAPTNTKNVYFDIEKESLPENFILQNKLVPKNTSEIALAEFGLEKNSPNFSGQKSLYYREGTSENDDYKILFDREAGKIWVKLTYFD